MNNISNPVILFDGICNLCNGAVNFVIRNDRNEILRFTSLQSNTGSNIMKQFDIDSPDPDSFILVYQNKVFNKSTAALMVLKLLGGRFALAYGFIIVPRFIRDGVYNIIATNRYKWFGKKESCMIPGKKISHLFLD